MPSGTGFVVDIGAKSGPLIALRADMDTLPVQDNKDVPYRSRIAHVCHACGHDVHTAILVCIFALHCDPSAEVGTVGTRTGPLTSATNHIVVKAKGVDGHPGRPHLTPNPLMTICHVVTSFSNAVNAQLPDHERILIAFGEISSNGTKNAIPSHAEAGITVRIPNVVAWLRTHSGQFDVDERAISVGVRILTRIAINAACAWKAWPKSRTDNNSEISTDESAGEQGPIHSEHDYLPYGNGDAWSHASARSCENRLRLDTKSRSLS
jgi:metal-dependent amidase/aminoacylase/carboxypeptidase family protein